MRPKVVAKYNVIVIIASCLGISCVLTVHNILLKKYVIGFSSASYPYIVSVNDTSSSDREVEGVGLWPLACWNRRFEYRWGDGCVSVVNVVCCQVEIFATGRSLVQTSPFKYLCLSVILGHQFPLGLSSHEKMYNWSCSMC